MEINTGDPAAASTQLSSPSSSVAFLLIRYVPVISLLQIAATFFWLFGIVVSFLVYRFLALLSITAYGRFLFPHNNSNNEPQQQQHHPNPPPHIGSSYTNNSFTTFPTPSSSSSTTTTSSNNYFLQTTIERLLSITVPKRWFTGFYIIGLCVNILVLYMTVTASYPVWGIFVVSLYSFHVLRRLGECLFVHKFSAEARMPLHLWLAGVAHYILAPFALLPTCSSIQSGASAMLNLVGLPLTLLLQQGSFLSSASGVVTMKNNTATSDGSSSNSNPLTSNQDADPLLLLATSNPLSLLRGISAVFFGFTLFMGGNIVQHLVHQKLASMRTSTDWTKSSNNYKKSSNSKKKRGRNAASGYTEDEDSGDEAMSPPKSSSTLRRNQISTGNNDSTQNAANMEGRGGDEENENQHDAQIDMGQSTTEGRSVRTIPLLPPLYPVPKGDLFDVVICPHYTAEIAIYIGLFVIQAGASVVFGHGTGEFASLCAVTSTSPSPTSSIILAETLPFFLGWTSALSLSRTWMQIFTAPCSLLLVLWVMANLVVTGSRTRAWYVKTFPEEVRVKYTAAVIPYFI